MIGIKLDKNKKISITKDIIEIEVPKNIYIPLCSSNNKNVTTLVKKDDYVCKGQIIGRTKGDFSIPIFSSVSGTVIDFIEKVDNSGEYVKCVVVENDYKEREEINREKINNISSYTQEEFIEKIHTCGVIGMGGSGFPTYVKYKTDKDIKTLIINAVECEPYITADYMLMKNKIEEILECCDAITEIFNIEECFIAIKVGNDEIKEIIKMYIGTYPKIKIIEVPDIYPMGWEKSLVRYIKHVDYEKLPIEKGIVVNNVSTVYAIYEALKYDKPLIERIITFSGDLCEEPQNIKVRVGTSTNDIIDSIIKTKDNDYILISGGPMMGNKTPTNEIIISANTNCILIFNNNTKLNTIECLRCGKCVRSCPVKITPVLIKDYINNIDKLKQLNVNKCIDCGICSYQCPSKINVREYVRTAKEKLRKDN